MKTLSIKEFAQANDIKSYTPAIRSNMNGYPFVTFITSSNEAMNIYFSKSAGEKIMEGEETLSVIKRLGCQIAETTNAEGEVRLKLISNSERNNIEDLF
jgi:hypothetical protein